MTAIQELGQIQQALGPCWCGAYPTIERTLCSVKAKCPDGHGFSAVSWLGKKPRNIVRRLQENWPRPKPTEQVHGCPA